MKSVQSSYLNAAIGPALLAGLLGSAGCATREVIFDGVALVRSNGQIVVVQRADSVAALKPALGLTDTEMELLTSLAVSRDQAHAQAAGTGGGAPRCLTGVGNPPPCYPMGGCKDCIVVSVDDVGGRAGAETEFAKGVTIPYAAPYSYYCKCTHQ